MTCTLVGAVARAREEEETQYDESSRIGAESRCDVWEGADGKWRRAMAADHDC